VTAGKSPADYRAEADLRLGEGTAAAGLVTSWRSHRNYLVSWLDREAGALVTDVVRGGRSLGRETSPLPAGFRYDVWHNLAAELRGRVLTVEVTDARLNDPVAVQRRELPPGTGGAGAVGAAARCGPADAANLGAARLYDPVNRQVPTPRVGGVVYSDQFNDGTVGGDGWTWVRPDPAATETGGVPPLADPGRRPGRARQRLPPAAARRPRRAPTRSRPSWPSTSAPTRSATSSRPAWPSTVNDDHFLRLSHVAIWNTRQTEFGKEQPFADGTSYGGMAIGTPAPVTWLRLSHRIDPANGEHEFRAATSRDGRHWTWGGVWTLPAGTSPRIGLVSHGGAGAVAEFDYFRIYRP
jgi:hypothetical protein